MNRREFMNTLAAGATALGIPQCTTVRPGAPARTQPNVVFIITDDQGYFDLGSHSNGVVNTPNLDRLYAESVRLTDFHVDPTCSPTRAALMTGRYRPRTGVWHTVGGRSLLREDEVTMADVFGASGYRTAIFGKWHLGDNYPFRPQDRGFHETLVHGGGGVGQTADYWGNDYFDDTYRHNGILQKYSGYCTDVWFDNAIDFIKKNRTRPFFCYIATNAPHAPYNVPERYAAPYRTAEAVEAYMNLPHAKTHKSRRPNPEFLGMVTNIDENVGRLERELERMGLRDDTIVIFMTDNGSAAGYKGTIRGNKGSEYDGGHRVPFFIRWPAAGLGGGRDVGRLTAHFDVLPTLIDLCGLRRPENVRFDGVSLQPLLAGNTRSWPARTIIVDSQRVETPVKWRRTAVLTERWRLVNENELYDIQADPEQNNDVAAEYPGVVRNLRRTYDKWWSDVSERFDEYCHIILGSDRENPCRLCIHDCHNSATSRQQAVADGKEGKVGFWSVELERDGRYRFALRRWPEEVNEAITAAIPGGTAIPITRARLRVGDVDESIHVSKDMKAAVFALDMKAGKTRMEAWFVDANGKTYPAYYVYVKRL